MSYHRLHRLFFSRCFLCTFSWLFTVRLSFRAIANLYCRALTLIYLVVVKSTEELLTIRYRLWNQAICAAIAYHFIFDFESILRWIISSFYTTLSLSLLFLLQTHTQSRTSDNTIDIFSNNNHSKSNSIEQSADCDNTSEPNDGRLANIDDACVNNVDNNDCDSGDSSIVVDDEPPSSSLNSSTEENRDELENHLNGTARSTTTTSAATTTAATKLIEPAVGSDWYLYCDDNFTNVNLIEEKIYEDLCYVTFSTKPEVRCSSTFKLTFTICFINRCVCACDLFVVYDIHSDSCHSDRVANVLVRFSVFFFISFACRFYFYLFDVILYCRDAYTQCARKHASNRY